MHPEHRDAQRKAKEIYYESYSVQVCELKRASKFDRSARMAAE
jgi:heme-degrading monooxygenase HmoA